MADGEKLAQEIEEWLELGFASGTFLGLWRWEDELTFTPIPREMVHDFGPPKSEEKEADDWLALAIRTHLGLVAIGNAQAKDDDRTLEARVGESELYAVFGWPWVAVWPPLPDGTPG